MILSHHILRPSMLTQRDKFDEKDVVTFIEREFFAQFLVAVTQVKALTKPLNGYYPTSFSEDLEVVLCSSLKDKFDGHNGR